LIDLVHARIIRGEDLNEPIKKWVVWFRSPFGYHETAHEAVKAVTEKALNLDPDVVIVPVAIAISASTYEPWEK
jgi:hypothetical protein